MSEKLNGELLIAVREAFYADHPDAKERLEKLKNG